MSDLVDQRTIAKNKLLIYHGTADPPDSSTAYGHHAFPGRSRPLCPWPRRAVYMGSRSTDDATNFECKETP